MGRKPDFVLIGAMKAGTTTLFRRLGQLETVDLPESKEPHFFSDEQKWAKGPNAYFAIFDGLSGITGEASAGYSDPAVAALVAERMASLIPDVRLLYSLRQPVDRMRSHYRHQVLRAREQRSFAAAVEDPASDYVRRSLYGQVLDTYLRQFQREQFLVYRLEELDEPESTTWSRILRHIHAPPAPMPSDRYYESSQRSQFTPVLLWLWRRKLLPSTSMPPLVRRLGKRLLTRPADHRSDLLDTAQASPPDHIIELLRRDQGLLESLGFDYVAVWHL